MVSLLKLNATKGLCVSEQINYWYQQSIPFYFKIDLCGHSSDSKTLTIEMYENHICKLFATIHRQKYALQVQQLWSAFTLSVQQGLGCTRPCKQAKSYRLGLSTLISGIILWEHVSAGKIALKFCRTKDMHAYMLTKPLGITDFLRHRDLLGMIFPSK